ncbi:MAG: general secretion pathway protein GspK, partial [Candidatus Sumerlaeia bacterium]|nr:general secretion pathway protein GspK [Candidatus Sumerlaeia bacterium]
IRRHSSPSRRQRGSTILIVLALLSVLVLVATTLTFTSRLEVISSQNFADGIQGRASGVSSLQALTKQASLNLNGDAASHLDFAIAATDPEMLDLVRKNVPGGENFSTPQIAAQLHRQGIRTPTSLVTFSDASARININTADQETLARLFSEVFSRHNVNASAGDLARRIVNHRDNGEKSETRVLPASFVPLHGRSLAQIWEEEAEKNHSTVSRPRGEFPFVGRQQYSYVPEEMGSPDALRAFFEGRDVRSRHEPDLRLPARNGERRFSAVSEIAYLDGFNPEVVGLLEPYLTVYSTSTPTMSTRAALAGHSPLDINRATAEEIHEALRALYGGAKEDNLLRQFAVNIVDARDGNSRRTSLPDSSGLGVVLGLERVPFITEVYPNSVTPASQGNDGQFIEIYNPWDESIVLDGWSVRAGAQNHPLRGVLPSRGFLIVTDDFDNTQDPQASDEVPGTGSFYDIFNMVPQGTHRRLIEHPALSLPHGAGRHVVELHDDGGNLADQFTYRVTDANEVFQSYQRYNLFIDESRLAKPTPFSLAYLDSELTAEMAERLRKMPKDGPFTDVMELFDIFAGYANPGGQRGRRWGFPVAASPNSSNPAHRILADDPTIIDARIIDIFTVEPLERPGREDLAKGLAAIHRKPSRSNQGETITPTRDKALITKAAVGVTPRGTRHGLVNVNTAPTPVLRAVGFTDLQAERMVSARTALEDQFLRGGSTEWVLWRTASDLLVDERVWGRIDPERPGPLLQQAGPVFRRISTGSAAFFLEGQALSPEDSQRVTRTGAKVQALIALDKEQPGLLWWRFAN